MFQYNNTQSALKVFERSFDFAVPCQGWQDYSRREVNPDDCEKHKQWILFKGVLPLAYQRLYSGIDYQRLALKQSVQIPGFRKSDVVQEYTSLYE